MQENKTILVTGATGSVGSGIARLIAVKEGFQLVILARNRSKAERLVEQVKNHSGRDNVRYVLADLSRKEEVKNLANQWQGPLHVLINNAGATPRERTETPEGIEYQWATNVLGYFWMIKYFTPHLKRSAPARVVNVASYWAGNMDLDDPEFRKRRYDNDSAYRQSKQADRMLTVAFAERLKDFKITVNACHPGDVRSTLASNLGYGGHETPEQGADTPVWVATSPSLEGITGKYFEHRRESTCRFGQDHEAVERLFQVCDHY
ncbi:MAG: SDR family NAD(P)-dependent oxidoreductase [bacterium]|jgi:retinol dehydrogenase 12